MTGKIIEKAFGYLDIAPSMRAFPLKCSVESKNFRGLENQDVHCVAGLTSVSEEGDKGRQRDNEINIFDIKGRYEGLEHVELQVCDAVETFKFLAHEQQI